MWKKITVLYVGPYVFLSVIRRYFVETDKYCVIAFSSFTMDLSYVVRLEVDQCLQSIRSTS